MLLSKMSHKENEDSQSYYSENSEEEDIQSAYQLQYVEFLKLRNTSSRY
jgi:hypothetical protein